MLKELNSAVSFFPSDLHVLNTPELYQIFSKMMVPAFLWGWGGKVQGQRGRKTNPFLVLCSRKSQMFYGGECVEDFVLIS